MGEGLFSSLLVASNPAIDAAAGDIEEGLNLLDGFTREAKFDHIDSLPLSSTSCARPSLLLFVLSSLYSTNMMDCIHARIKSGYVYICQMQWLDMVLGAVVTSSDRS